MIELQQGVGWGNCNRWLDYSASDNRFAWGNYSRWSNYSASDNCFAWGNCSRWSDYSASENRLCQQLGVFHIKQVGWKK